MREDEENTRFGRDDSVVAYIASPYLEIFTSLLVLKRIDLKRSRVPKLWE